MLYLFENILKDIKYSVKGSIVILFRGNKDDTQKDHNRTQNTIIEVKIFIYTYVI